MKEIAKTFDPVRLSFLRSVLADAGIEFAVLDSGAGAIWPGAIPFRLMVDDKDAWRAKTALAEAGEADE